ncbi:MAG: hypothetical protein E6Q42_09710 [Dechloromonas sp.]|uniref:hypothetical protein n=1 Tax=Azospira sp. I09 TaxID=1765049 RepID=UPI0011D85C97|nr:hypothetical protein [Azospira sp. I09]TXI75264.1 MAG: hypothetical protein E6Q42_09710 [Dechloromonas sp.]BBN90664.1 hypothetical protein AZSP09_36870 [Azospira sp. I09]
MRDNAEAKLQNAARKPRRKKQDLEFIKFRARLFSDESLLKFGTNEKGERVCYGVCLDKLCQAIDEGRF